MNNSQLKLTQALPTSMQPLLRLFALSYLLLLTGCEDRNKHEDSAINATTSPSNQVVRELVRGNFYEPASLDPHKVQSYEVFILLDLHEGLVNLSPSGEILPGVAESWKSENNQVYTFFLRHDARWSNGDPVTAEDFVYSWRRLVTPATASPYGSYLEMARIQNARKILAGEVAPETLGVTAIDKLTLQVTLERPLGYFISMLPLPMTAPVHRPTIERHGDKWTRPEHHVGNGAFRLSEWTPNSHVSVTTNPFYWRADDVRLDKVTFLPITSPHTELSLFLAGDIDITARVPSEHFDRLLQERPTEVRTTPTFGTRFVTFNIARPPFDNPLLRKALSYAIDRDVLTSKVVGAGTIPTYSLTPMTILTDQPESIGGNTLEKKQREAMAKEFYAQAIPEAQQPLRFELIYQTGSNNKKEALALSAMWKSVLGVEAEPLNLDNKDRLQRVEQGDFSVALSQWLADYVDASSILDLYRSDSSLNVSRHQNPMFDRLLGSAASIADANDRNNLYLQAEEILAEEAAVAPLYQWVNSQLVKPHVGGYELSPTFYLYSKNLWIKEGH